MAGGFSHLLRTRSPARRWIVEHPQAPSARNQLFQQFDSLCIKFGRKDAYPSHVAAGPCQVVSKPGVYEVVSNTYDRKRPGRSLRYPPCLFSICEDHGCAFPHDCFSEPLKPIKLALGETHL